ncbi:CPBP family intramembrane metalloprotease [Staphylococcus devriesei]|uniref:CPBP family intramembrane metalloprotease n=1 Tax=Staphylococcus devriesei TaxID=586733 RepID=A0A2T4KHE4_9STAP|nr:type II CAAX endopeptidase family protein [Staphylococcus devriesei]MCE5091000.1 CPBP family intramembrane metalloprotease [Staphylococcus devriesei]PTE73341.1 CPBP family intramembrane metalloprotease [Staphylococcus devriesei]PTF02512.1 CPBP family intramembrane metalloprotease [Staphylococcus devriesei]PTF14837.1 CPBP family intramembrane metalloprotease [Staphylococcus devriesei]RIL70920.1 CPBP family intramembrane metalloprotease [Staphylococcus devriesei]
MARIWVASLTLVIYALAQVLPLMLQQTPLFSDLSGMALARANVYTQVILFIIAAILIIWLNLIIKNPTSLEKGFKEPKRYIIPWALLGFVIVMVYQVMAGVINMWIFGQPQQSPNTQKIMAIARQLPIFILLISCVGPILEEYVFRKILFGEIYNKIKGNRIVAFLIASIISSLLFALAHDDMKFILIYFGMGMLFSLAYVLTKRIAVPILIHMFQNGLVVIMQYFFGDTLKNLQEQTNFIFHLLF